MGELADEFADGVAIKSWPKPKRNQSPIADA